MLAPQAGADPSCQRAVTTDPARNTVNPCPHLFCHPERAQLVEGPAFCSGEKMAYRPALAPQKTIVSGWTAPEPFRSYCLTRERREGRSRVRESPPGGPNCVPLGAENRQNRLFARRETGIEYVHRHRAKVAEMTASAWNWLLAISGTVASVAGVVFSCMAWVQAKGAKKAAQEATEAIRKRNAAQEFLRLAGDAKEFLSAVQQSRTENAISAANSLVHALAILRTRSVSRVSDVNMLKKCEGEIIRVIVGLNADGVPIDPSSYSDVLDRCHAIHRTVCELAGRMERLSEGAVL